MFDKTLHLPIEKLLEYINKIETICKPLFDQMELAKLRAEGDTFKYNLDELNHLMWKRRKAMNTNHPYYIKTHH